MKHIQQNLEITVFLRFINIEKKRTAACNSNGWPKLQVFSVGLNIIIILSAIK